MPQIADPSPPYFSLEALTEDDVQALSRRIVPEWVVARTIQMLDYELPELQANAAKPVKERKRRLGFKHNRNAYSNHGCRCEICTVGNREHSREMGNDER